MKKYDRFSYTLNEIRWWLSTQSVYSKHNQKRKRGKYRKLYSPQPGYLMDIDTGYFKEGKSPFKHFILGIDTFSHLVHIVPIKAITAKNAIKAFDEIIEHVPTPYMVRSDKGVEFKNQYFSKHLLEKKIRLFFSAPPHKSSRSEMSIKKFKSIMAKLMSVNKGKNWVQLLPDALHILNHKFNTSINMSPFAAAKPENLSKVITYSNSRHLRQQGEPRSQFRYQLNEQTKVRLTKGPLDKAHTPNFSDELYEIVNRKLVDNVEYYYLKTTDGDVIPDAFHYTELAPVGKKEDKFVIEKILQPSRTKNGRLFKLVKWLNSPMKTYVAIDELPHFQLQTEQVIGT